MSAARRVAVVLLAYVVVAGTVWAVAGWARRVLALPASFLDLLGIGLAVGLPLAGLLAWYYPRLGHHGIHPDHADSRSGGRDP